MGLIETILERKHLIDFRNRDNIVKKTIDSAKEYRNKQKIRIIKRKIKLNTVPREKVLDFIDWRGRIFDIFHNTFGFSNPRELFEELKGNYYHFKDYTGEKTEGSDYDEYIIADKVNTDSNGNKNTDTIICVDEARYYRIKSDNTSIEYESYDERKLGCTKCLLIRKTINEKEKIEFINYKILSNRSNGEYIYEQEENGRCSITIQGRFPFADQIQMIYESKEGIMLGKQPISVTVINHLNRTDFEKDKKDRKGRYIKKTSIRPLKEDEFEEKRRFIGEPYSYGEWGEERKSIGRYSYAQMVRSCVKEVELIDLDMVDPEIIKNGIKANIPDRVLEVYYNIHPEMAMKIDSSVKDRIIFSIKNNHHTTKHREDTTYDKRTEH